MNKDYELYNLIELYLRSLDKLDDYEKGVIAKYIELCITPVVINKKPYKDDKYSPEEGSYADHYAQDIKGEGI